MNANAQLGLPLAAMSQYETKVVFNGVVSFRDKGAAAQFLSLVGSVVDDSVEVFHAKAEPG